jgi:hypothetical protein
MGKNSPASENVPHGVPVRGTLSSPIGLYPFHPSSRIARDILPHFMEYCSHAQ